MDWLARKLTDIRTLWNNLGTQSRVLALGLLAAAALAVALVTYLNRPQFVTMSSGLEAREAAEVVAKLDELRVAYRLAGDGTTILVPKTEVYSARLALAQAGLPRGTSTGWELFDQQRFGQTEFDRRVNYQRALQGELERAIMRMGQVEYANVKIAIPEPAVFTRDQKPVTAAVLVDLRPGNPLTPEQVAGIAGFVARSVEGLTPEQVLVVDNTGRVLAATGGQGSDLDQLSAQQLGTRLEMERQLETRLRSLLEPVFGPGNVVASVSLDISFDRVNIETLKYLPTGGEKGVLRSNEVVREIGSSPTGTASLAASGAPGYGMGGTGGDFTHLREISNYEIPEQRISEEIAPGAVRRVSVGVFINNPVLGLEQSAQVQATVAQAVGANPQDVTVTPMAFNRDLVKQLQAQPAAARPLPVSTGALAASAAMLLLLFLLSLIRRRSQQVVLATEAGPVTVAHLYETQAPAATEEGPSPRDKMADDEELIREMQRRAMLVEEEDGVPELTPATLRHRMKHRVEQIIQEQPATAVALLRTWLAED